MKIYRSGLQHIFILLTFAIYSFSPLHSTSQSIDVLEDSLKKNNLSNEEKINLYCVIAREYSFVDAAKALKNAKKALLLSRELGYSSGIANAYRILGSVYSQNDNYYQSLEFFLMALDIFKQNNDSLGIANVYVSMGHYYNGINKLDKQIYYHSLSLDFFRKLAINERIGVATHNLSESMLLSENFEKCRALALESILINKQLGKLSILSSCYNILGRLAVEVGEEEEAITQFERVLEISNTLGENSQKVATVSALLNLSEIYRGRRQDDLMLQYLNSAARIANSSLMSEKLAKIYFKLIEYYTERKQYDSIKWYQQQYQVLSNKKAIERNEASYELINSVSELYTLKKENDDLEKSILIKENRLKLTYISIGFVLILILITVLILFTIVTKNKKLALQQSLIEDQKNHLEALNLTKNKFFSIVAHDLKSPLNSLKSFSNLLLSHSEKLSKEEIVEMSKGLKSSLDNTVEMADNLISWARIQMDDISIDKSLVAIEEVLSPIAALSQGIADQKEIKLISNFQNDLHINVDLNHLRFVIRNILNNAIKFTKRNGYIKLSTLERCGKIEITVEDDGLGMSQKVQKNLFKLEHKQSLAGTEGEAGTGLGLMLCKEFMVLNQGEILIESKENKGTTIRLIFDKA